MSQVIVTKDRYKDKRESSGNQERKITRFAGIERWQRSDVTKPDPLARSVGFVIAGLFGWVTAIGLGVLALINLVIFKPLAVVFGNRNKDSQS